MKLGRPQTNFIAGFRIVIQTANEPRRTIYRKGKTAYTAISNASYISGFIGVLSCEPLNQQEWETK